MERTNLWQTVHFDLVDEGVPLCRRLVPHAADLATELSADSPIGRVLLRARPGETIRVATPGGEISVRVNTILP
jgi:transcription elongation GreA/GreB family factor